MHEGLRKDADKTKPGLIMQRHLEITNHMLSANIDEKHREMRRQTRFKLPWNLHLVGENK